MDLYQTLQDYDEAANNHGDKVCSQGFFFSNLSTDDTVSNHILKT